MTALTAIAAVPVATDFDAFNETVKGIFRQYNIRFVDIPFTTVIGGKRLVAVSLESPSESNPRGALQALINANSLDWDIMRLQNWLPAQASGAEVHGVQSDLSAWIVPQPLTDADGNQVGTWIPELHTFSGQEPWS